MSFAQRAQDAPAYPKRHRIQWLLDDHLDDAEANALRDMLTDPRFTAARIRQDILEETGVNVEESTVRLWRRTNGIR